MKLAETDWSEEEKPKVLNATTQHSYLMKASNN